VDVQRHVARILYRGMIFDILGSEIKYIIILESGINYFQIPAEE
jgi:hypothetical protein